MNVWLPISAPSRKPKISSRFPGTCVVCFGLPRRPRSGRPLIAAWADSFLERYPDIKLELSVTDRRVDLIRESFDIAVRIGEQQDTSLIGRSLGVLHYVLAASPKYLERRGTPTSIDDLKQHACLRHLLAGRPMPFRFADGTRIVPDGPFDTDDAQYLIEAGLEGAGITQFMRLVIEDELAAGRLRIVLPEIPMFTTPVFVLHPFGRQLPLRARLFIDFLVEAIAGFPADNAWKLRRRRHRTEAHCQCRRVGCGEESAAVR